MKEIILIVTFFIFQTVSSQVEAQVTPEPDENIYNIVGIETKPEYPGGMSVFYEYINSEFRDPKVNGLKGIVFVCFIVEKDGSLTDIKVLRDTGHDTGEKVVRLLKNSLKWTPGYQNGRKVRVMYSLPINISAN